jgi:hypothetical protein
MTYQVLDYGSPSPKKRKELKISAVRNHGRHHSRSQESNQKETYTIKYGCILLQRAITRVIGQGTRMRKNPVVRAPSGEVVR